MYTPGPSGPSGPSELGGVAATCPGGLGAQRTVPGLVVKPMWKTGGFIHARADFMGIFMGRLYI